MCAVLEPTSRMLIEVVMAVITGLVLRLPVSVVVVAAMMTVVVIMMTVVILVVLPAVTILTRAAAATATAATASAVVPTHMVGEPVGQRRVGPTVHCCMLAVAMRNVLSISNS